MYKKLGFHHDLTSLLLRGDNKSMIQRFKGFLQHGYLFADSSHAVAFSISQGEGEVLGSLSVCAKTLTMIVTSVFQSSVLRNILNVIGSKLVLNLKQDRS
jgi:hypothetical protein